MRARADPDPDGHAQPHADTDVQPQPIPDADAQSVAVPVPQSLAQPDTEPLAQPDTEPLAQPDTEPGAEPGACATRHAASTSGDTRTTHARLYGLRGLPMNRPHFRRHPRPVDPNPEYSRLDRLDGLPGRTRYDAEWVDVLAAEAPPKWADLFGIDPGFVGGDLAAMAAPWPGMARDDLGDYAEPVEPHGRHRQTDPLDLLLADLRDIEDRLAEIMALADAATEGPWEFRPYAGGEVCTVDRPATATVRRYVSETVVDYVPVDEDGAFIAAARTLVPELVAGYVAVLAECRDMADAAGHRDRIRDAIAAAFELTP